METAAALPAIYPASYSQFDLQTVLDLFSLEPLSGSCVNGFHPSDPSAWLQETLQKSSVLALDSEKAKSEYIIAPILLAASELRQPRLLIHSGARFDVDPARGLRGYCDFILGAGKPFPAIQAPLLMLVEVKEDSLDGARGQCAAEMVAADLFNRRRGHPGRPVFGCVTNTFNWQFLRLENATLTVDPKIHYRDSLPDILGIFQAMADEAAARNPAALRGA